LWRNGIRNVDRRVEVLLERKKKEHWGKKKKRKTVKKQNQIIWMALSELRD
jgi:hypothetical protein